MALLEVRDLHVHFSSPHGLVRAVDGVNLTLERGQTLALVGPSGAGKTLTGLAVMGLLPADGRTRQSGSIRFEGQELRTLSSQALRRLRGDRLSMVFQDPTSALNPVLTVGRQLTEVLETHRKLGAREARAQTLKMLEDVRLPDAERRFDQYPHELSLGMRQRVLMAMALLLRPALLVADEPTSALDVTLQAELLDLLERLRTESGTSVLLITHDWGVVAERADDVAVMEGGKIVEHGSASALFAHPKHRCTQALLVDTRRARQQPFTSEGLGTGTEPLLELQDVRVRHPQMSGGLFRRRRGWVEAVDGVSLRIHRGEIWGILGESGCGKSSLCRALLRLIPVSGGAVRFEGEDWLAHSGEELRQRRRKMQLVFQEAQASLSPHLTVEESLSEPLELWGEGGRVERAARVTELLERCHLSPTLRTRRPHELSGGQHQRVALARALAPGPSLLVADEPWSALDAVHRHQVLALLAELRRDLGLTVLVLGHDLVSMQQLTDQIAVMYRGKWVEVGPAAQIFSTPAHPYTQVLLEAAPVPDPNRRAGRTRSEGPSGLAGVTLNSSSGCRFQPRCPRYPLLESTQRRRCLEELPLLRTWGNPTGEGTRRPHDVACHFVEQLTPSTTLSKDAF